MVTLRGDLRDVDHVSSKILAFTTRAERSVVATRKRRRARSELNQGCTPLIILMSLLLSLVDFDRMAGVNLAEALLPQNREFFALAQLRRASTQSQQSKRLSPSRTTRNTVTSVSSMLATTTKSASLGSMIQEASNIDDLLKASALIWLPTDDDLPPHYSQSIHHDHRQNWASQWLEKYAKFRSANRHSVVATQPLTRVVAAAALPSPDPLDPVRTGRNLRLSVISLYTIVRMSSLSADLCFNLESSLELLLERAEACAETWPMPTVVEVRWAARGIRQSMFCASHGSHMASPNLTFPVMDRRVQALPFDIIPQGIEWQSILANTDSSDIVPTLLESIPFSLDTITTRRGEKVTERRRTAWLAEPGIGALAYSGKLMAPQSPIPEVVAKTMRDVEQAVMSAALSSATAALATVRWPEQPRFFDCALCNHYPDHEAACKFHTDPEHGTVWDRFTCVVAAGSPRRFAFRPIPQVTAWNDWDTSATPSFGAAQPPQQLLPTEEQNRAVVVNLFPGDIVIMIGSCNDDFHHAVYAADSEPMPEIGRISLVLKRAMVRGKRRGHGLPGEGRRSRQLATTEKCRSARRKT
jgi:hypothetical protein